MKTNIKLFLIAALAMMSVHGWADWTVSKTIYFDFTAVPGGGGVNWSNGSCGSVGYQSNGAGTVISHTFSSTTFNTNCILFKTEYGGWAEVKWSNPNGKNCVKVNADGKTFSWTTYSPGHTLTFTKTGSGSVSGKVDGSSASSPVSSVEEGTEIELTASPSSSSYVFTCWKVGDDIVSYDNPYTFDMPDADITVTAEFEDNRKSSGGCGNCFTVE